MHSPSWSETLTKGGGRHGDPHTETYGRENETLPDAGEPDQRLNAGQCVSRHSGKL
jgi:hypothetical protein